MTLSLYEVIIKEQQVVEIPETFSSSYSFSWQTNAEPVLIEFSHDRQSKICFYYYVLFTKLLAHVVLCVLAAHCRHFRPA